VRSQAGINDSPCSKSNSLAGGFRFADRFLVQFPTMDRFPASFPREAGTELPLGVVECLFRVQSGAASFVIRIFHAFG